MQTKLHELSFRRIADHFLNVTTLLTCGVLIYMCLELQLVGLHFYYTSLRRKTDMRNLIWLGLGLGQLWACHDLRPHRETVYHGIRQYSFILYNKIYLGQWQ